MKDADRSSNVKAGAFVLLALVVLVAGSLWIAGRTGFGPSQVSYRVPMADSGGLQPGDRVRIAGVSVGRIQSLDLRTGDERPVELTVGIRSEFEIREDATAKVATTGLMGKAYLDVNPGSPGRPPLAAGQSIRGTPSAGIEEALAQLTEISESAKALLEQTATVVQSVSREIGPLLENMNALLSDQNADDLRVILANLRTASDEAVPRVTSLLARLDAVSVSLERGTADVPQLTEQLSEVLTDLQTALGPDGQRLTSVLEAAEDSLGRAGDAMAVVGNNRGELEATLVDLRDVVANLKAFSQGVKERPFSLVRIRPEADRQPGEGVAGNR